MHTHRGFDAMKAEGNNYREFWINISLLLEISKRIVHEDLFIFLKEKRIFSRMCSCV